MYPIYINNRDRLTMTRRLAAQCERLADVAEIVIVDNASTYPPLLDWYAECPYRVVRFPENRGMRGVWSIELAPTHYIETDCDLDLGRVPLDALALLRDGLDRWPEILKVGLSLETEGIPGDYRLKSLALARESEMWGAWPDPLFHAALIDTTFAMYRPGSAWGSYGPALRTARPYTALHAPWHEPETDEDRYYYARLDWRESVYGGIAGERFR